MAHDRVNDADETQRLRIAQWATGNIGTRALRAVIDHPRYELVALFVYSDDKVGVDAGSLCGADETGVLATRDRAQIIDSQPDCVLYMPRYFDLDDVCAFLESGINVVTTRGEFHRPASMNPADRQRVEAACLRGGATVHSTGSSPGFITEALPVALTSLQRRLDRLTIDEFADVSRRPSPELLFEVMGFGREPGEFDAHRLAHLQGSFGPSLVALADSLGIVVDEVTATGEFAVARDSFDIAAGTIGAGTVAAQRIVVSAMRAGEAVLQFRANWYCGTDVVPSWSLRETGWRVGVEGDTPMNVDIFFPVPMEQYAAVMPGYTAHRAVNAVPFVVGAPPGIATTADLPPIAAYLGT